MSGGLVEADLVVTKFVNGIPTTYDASQYTLTFSGTTTYLNFTGSNVPEVGSSLIVSKWTKAQITDHIRERASWEASDNTIATYDKWQEGNAPTFMFVDVTTGTGFVQFVTATEKTDLLTANTNDILIQLLKSVLIVF